MNGTLQDSESRSTFTVLFAVVAFLVSGAIIFTAGARAAFPSPTSAHEAFCGNCIFGGFVVMMIGAPLGAMTAALVGGVSGWILDTVLEQHCRDA